MKILYEDDNIIVCIKPAGVLSEESEKANMVSLIEQHCGAKPFPVHRLDRETAGIMVFAKKSQIAAALSQQIQNGKFKKRYLAAVCGHAENEQGIFEDLLFRDKQKNKSFVVKRERKGVKKASLEYKIIGEKEGLSLADVLLHTGRTHQIRVQFASRKLPLYGDGKYGGAGSGLALFAYSLSFENPVDGKLVTFTSLPDCGEYPWSVFADEISRY